MLFRRSFFFHYLSPYTGRLALNVLLRTLSAVFTTVLVFSVAPLLSLLFGTAGGLETMTGSNNSAVNALMDVLESWVTFSIAHNGKTVTLVWVVASLFGAYFLKDLCAYLGLYWFTPIRNKMVATLRQDLYHQYLILPLSFYTKAQKGDLLSRISHNTQDVDNQMLNQIQQVLVDVITLVFLVAMLFFISVPLSVFILVLVPVIGYITSLVSRSLRRKSKALQDSVGRISSQTSQSLDGVKTIRSYNATDDAVERFKKENAIFYRYHRHVGYRTSVASPLNDILGTTAVVAALMMGGWLILHEKSLRPEVFIVYLLTLIQILPSSKNIITAYFTFRSGKGSLDRIKEILRAEEVVVEKPDAVRMNTFDKELEFKDVCFKYEDEKQTEDAASEPERTTLQDINLRIERGKFIALVGPSGGGKSTLLNMIPRFFDPTSGAVLLDGKDLRDCKISDIRALSSLVSQDTVLFNDSVLNNIRLGNPKASREAIIEAAKKADAHDFIQEMEEGYDTSVGDGGSKLSGGQRQRISIARALVKDAPILLFDEATSALDTATENRIMHALQQVGKEQNRTIVSIAHRLSSIRQADEIIVIDQGRIVGRGTHESLFENHPLYRKLCLMQDTQNLQENKE